MFWEDLFEKHILQRGFNYYLEGTVQSLVKNTSSVFGVVRGNDLYSVDIEFEGEEVASMFCTCPYAKEQDYCKHMAAVLFEYDRRRRSYEK